MIFHPCLAPLFWATDPGFRDWCAHFERLMRPGVIVQFEPMVDDDLCLLGHCEPLRIENPRRNVPLNRSLYPFSEGDPG